MRRLEPCAGVAEEALRPELNRRYFGAPRGAVSESIALTMAFTSAARAADSFCPVATVHALLTAITSRRAGSMWIFWP
jgi:hypothetical protein